MQTYKLYFVLMLMVVFSSLVSAGNIYVNEGKITLEGQFEISSSEDSTTFISEDGNSMVINQPLGEIPLDEDSLEKAEINYVGKDETYQGRSKINSEEQSSGEKSASVTGAVISSRSKNYILPILMIFIVIIGILVVLKIWKMKNKLISFIYL